MRVIITVSVALSGIIFVASGILLWASDDRGPLRIGRSTPMDDGWAVVIPIDRALHDDDGVVVPFDLARRCSTATPASLTRKPRQGSSEAALDLASIPSDPRRRCAVPRRIRRPARHRPRPVTSDGTGLDQAIQPSEPDRLLGSDFAHDVVPRRDLDP